MYAYGTAHSFLMVFIFRTTKALNNEVVFPGLSTVEWSMDSQSQGWLLRFIISAFSTSLRARKHRHVRAAWMNRCKHLFCLFRPPRHSLAILHSFSSSVAFRFFSPSVCKFVSFSTYRSLPLRFQSLFCVVFMFKVETFSQRKSTSTLR